MVFEISRRREAIVCLQLFAVDPMEKPPTKRRRLVFIACEEAQNVDEQVNEVEVDVDDNHWNVRVAKPVANKAVDVVNREAKEKQNA